MTTYTVHEQADLSGTIAERADAVTFVKEGFAWLALFFPVIWLAINRMWIVLAAFVGLLILIEVSLDVAGAGGNVAAWTASALVLMFAFQANDLRRWTLARQGYHLAWPVTGTNLAACEVQFFDAWLSEQTQPGHVQPGLAEQVVTSRAAANPRQGDPKSDSSDDIIGLFPDENP